MIIKCWKSNIDEKKYDLNINLIYINFNINNILSMNKYTVINFFNSNTNIFLDVKSKE